MKVRELIRILKTYDTEEEIAVAWFRKEDTEGWYSNPPTEEQWDLAVENFENNSYNRFSDDVADYLENIMEETNEQLWYDGNDYS